MMRYDAFKLINAFSIIKWRILWLIIRKKFAKIGVNAHVGQYFDIRNSEYIRIGDNFVAGNYFRLHTWPMYNGKNTGYYPNLQIGNNVTFTENCYVSCMNSIKIGDGVLFGHNVFITDNYHGMNSINEFGTPPKFRKLYSKGGVVIGDNVWIGCNVCIMPGLTIGNNVVIGANSVVTHDIAENCIACGAPAKVVKLIS